MTDAAMATPTRRADMWYAGTASQRRLTVAFRIILAIPQFIVLYFLAVATFFVAVIGWFAALFMGRLPEWAHSFLSGMVRWFTRVAAYMYLLTDRYPPFSLDDEEYPARPVLPAPGRLNRWAVLFRLILAIPAAVFSQIVQYGLTFPILLVMWFVVLISGRMPPSLYATYSALLRYQVRFHTYFLMLTSVYAWGMLGDPAAPPPPALGAPPAPGFGAPPAPGFGAPPAPAPPPPTAPPPTGTPQIAGIPNPARTAVLLPVSWREDHGDAARRGDARGRGRAGAHAGARSCRRSRTGTGTGAGGARATGVAPARAASSSSHASSPGGNRWDASPVAVGEGGSSRSRRRSRPRRGRPLSSPVRRGAG